MSPSAMYSGHKLFGYIQSVTYTFFKTWHTLPRGVCRCMIVFLPNWTKYTVSCHIVYNILIKSKKLFKNVKITLIFQHHVYYNPSCSVSPGGGDSKTGELRVQGVKSNHYLIVNISQYIIFIFSLCLLINQLKIIYLIMKPAVNI